MNIPNSPSSMSLCGRSLILSVLFGFLFLPDAGIAQTSAPNPASPPNLLKLDDSISVTGRSLKIQQTESGGIRISGTNDLEGGVFYFGKVFSAPQEVSAIQVEMTGIEKPILAIVRDEKGSVAHKTFRPDSGENMLDLGSMRFSKGGREETFAGKVDKIAFTITMPAGEFVIDINSLQLIP